MFLLCYFAFCLVVIAAMIILTKIHDGSVTWADIGVCAFSGAIPLVNMVMLVFMLFCIAEKSGIWEKVVW